ncbi:hypothetical protein SAMN05880501_112109 [Ureibacillus xyleni]|uniref:Uncharacterized protein n=1 Tax=Ureibacillus xyleni TaxID=614648 RepID=A0A285TFN8_9BACL|nr:hypothetical protein [Ureibacillus xyleni]SOC21074.1 hypothetical protein SAMN05880501_112109 [Ureibacillus xyleni]
MNIFATQQVNGNRDFGITTSVKNNNGTTSFKAVFGDEARKINPLHDVNNSRNNLIYDAIETNDWSKYYAFEAKQQPAWYEQVNGQYVPNKMYYSSLIEANMNAVQEAKLDGDKELAAIWENNLQQMINKFNQAPGIVPYVVGLNHREDLAAQYGVAMADKSFFDSKYNSQLVATQGKFEQNMWYDNTYFAENKELKDHVAALVSENVPKDSMTNSSSLVATSEEIKTPTSIIEDSVSDSTVTKKQTEVIQNIVAKGDIDTASINLIEGIQENQQDSNDQLEKESAKKQDLQELYLHNLKFAFHPNFKLVKESYI